jgi:hypothetical protein
MNETFGAIYLAFGKPYLAMAAVSAASAKAHTENLQAAVVTNVAPQPDEFKHLPFDHWIYVDDKTENNRQHKIQVNRYSPFDKTVFLDCDTVAVGSLSDLSGYLDDFDLAMQITGLLAGYKHSDVQVLNGKRIGSLPHWNSGVIPFANRPEVHEFFDKWKESFARLNISSDQPACVEAVFSSRARHLSLDFRWNAPALRYIQERDTPSGEKYRIAHYTSNVLTPDVEHYLRRVDDVFVQDFGFDNDGAIQNFINEKHHKRTKAGRPIVEEPLLNVELEL